MQSWRQTLGSLRRIADALNDYHWEKVGTLSSLSDRISDGPGVYKITDGIHEYIGRAIAKGGLRARLRRHISNPRKEWKNPEDRSRFDVYVQSIDDVATVLEAYLIVMLKPDLNVQGKRGVV